MGKTAKPSKKTPSTPLPKCAPKPRTRRNGILHVQGDPNMPEEQYRRQLALADWLVGRQVEARSMTAEQAREEDEKWQQFKRSINQRRAAYRKLYLD